MEQLLHEILQKVKKEHKERMEGKRRLGISICLVITPDSPLSGLDKQLIGEVIKTFLPEVGIEMHSIAISTIEEKPDVIRFQAGEELNMPKTIEKELLAFILDRGCEEDTRNGICCMFCGAFTDGCNEDKAEHADHCLWKRMHPKPKAIAKPACYECGGSGIVAAYNGQEYATDNCRTCETKAKRKPKCYECNDTGKVEVIGEHGATTKCQSLKHIEVRSKAYRCSDCKDTGKIESADEEGDIITLKCPNFSHVKNGR